MKAEKPHNRQQQTNMYTFTLEDVGPHGQHNVGEKRSYSENMAYSAIMKTEANNFYRNRFNGIFAFKKFHELLLFCDTE